MFNKIVKCYNICYEINKVFETYFLTEHSHIWEMLVIKCLEDPLKIYD